MHHLVVFIKDVAARRVLRLPAQRSEDRARASIARRFLWIMHMLEAAWPNVDDNVTTWRHDRLPATLNLNGLLDHLAHVVGSLHSAPKSRPRQRRRTTPTVTDPVALLLAFFRTCVRDGVFEPRIPCHAANHTISYRPRGWGVLPAKKTSQSLFSSQERPRVPKITPNVCFCSPKNQSPTP